MHSGKQRVVVRTRRGPPIEVFFTRNEIEIDGMKGRCLALTQDGYLVLADHPHIVPAQEAVKAHIVFQSQRVITSANSNHTKRHRR